MCSTDSNFCFRNGFFFIAAIPIILIVQILLVSQSVDALSLTNNPEIHGWKKVFSYLGDVAKVLTLSLFVYFTIAWRRVRQWLFGKKAIHISWKRFILYSAFQFSVFIYILYLSKYIYGTSGDSSNVSSASLISFAFAISVCGILSLLSVAKLGDIIDFALIERKYLLISVVASIVIWMASSFVKESWSGLSGYTFILVRVFLGGYSDEYLYIDPDRKEIGIGDFVVSIDPACSGYEGLGLIVSFVSIYLFVNRNNLKFPISLILYPIGLLFIWILNGFRIAALVAIGHHVSPEIAIGGFHSQAGWISFILSSILLLWIAGKSQFVKTENKSIQGNKVNLSIATLIPMVVLLSVTLVASAFTSSFDYLYPLRVIAVSISIAILWPYFKFEKFRPTFLSIFVAIFVSSTWILFVEVDAESGDSFSKGLSTMSVEVLVIWLAFRFIGSVLTVPIAEELAFRGYILCRLSKIDVVLNGKVGATAASVIFSSILFGALHESWIAGTSAGLCYALVRIKGKGIVDAIFSHAVTNLILFSYAAVTSSWWLI